MPGLQVMLGRADNGTMATLEALFGAEVAPMTPWHTGDVAGVGPVRMQPPHCTTIDR
jgi:hypothetical protein